MDHITRVYCSFRQQTMMMIVIPKQNPFNDHHNPSQMYNFNSLQFATKEWLLNPQKHITTHLRDFRCRRNIGHIRVISLDLLHNLGGHSRVAVHILLLVHHGPGAGLRVVHLGRVRCGGGVGDVVAQLGNRLERLPILVHLLVHHIPLAGPAVVHLALEGRRVGAVVLAAHVTHQRWPLRLQRLLVHLAPRLGLLVVHLRGGHVRRLARALASLRVLQRGRFVGRR